MLKAIMFMIPFIQHCLSYSLLIKSISGSKLKRSIQNNFKHDTLMIFSDHLISYHPYNVNQLYIYSKGFDLIS